MSSVSAVPTIRPRPLFPRETKKRQAAITTAATYSVHLYEVYKILCLQNIKISRSDHHDGAISREMVSTCSLKQELVIRK